VPEIIADQRDLSECNSLAGVVPTSPGCANLDGSSNLCLLHAGLPMMNTSAAGDDSLDKDRQALLAYFRHFPFSQLMGMEIVELEPGRARISMSWREDLCQPAGILHGGAIASLVDTSIAHSILLTPEHRAIRDEHGGRLVSVDLRIKYLRPVSSGLVLCDARVVRMGRQIIHADAVVTAPDGKEVALGDSIYMMVKGKQLEKK